MKDKRIIGYLLLWGLADLLCAMFCEIHADEAYYRLYGQFLDWGYFDHPPMVGLMTAASATLVNGTSLILKNLSVRLVTVLMHMATVWLLWRTIAGNRKQETGSVLPFILITASMPMFCAYGFITTPDAPLLFFAALFYYAYRRFLEEHSWTATALLAFSMAGMMYSKYMALLVIGFAVLGNWRLLRDGKAWAAVGLATLLFLPHLWWQYTNGFPSFSYHLVDRATSYNPLYTAEFVPNQWAVFNPVVWVLMLWLGGKQMLHGDAFGRSAGVTIIGFQLFFLLMTLRGHAEPHWTMVTSIPAAVLLTEEWNRTDRKQSLFRHKGVRAAIAVCAVLVLVARGILMLNVLPVQTGLAGKQAYYESLHDRAQGHPIVFDGSFQHPSLYRFFYNDEAVLVRNGTDRYTQYDLLHLERGLMGKPVCLMRHGSVRFVSSLSPEDLQ